MTIQFVAQTEIYLKAKRGAINDDTRSARRWLVDMGLPTQGTLLQVPRSAQSPVLSCSLGVISQPLARFIAIHWRDFDSTLPLQYSCLENPTDRGAWQTAVHGVEKSRTPLSD